MSFEVDGAENRLGDSIARVKEAFRRRWRTFLAFFVLVFVAGVIVLFSMSPRYEAVARLRLDPARDPMVDSMQEKASLNPEAIQTEVGLLQSTELGLTVVKRLNLRNDPRYLKDLPEGLTGAALDAALASVLYENLGIGRKELTYIIEVKYLSRDPAEAARVANAYVDAYLDQKLSLSTGTAARQAEFYREQLKGLGSDVRRAEADVARYRAATGIVVNSSRNSSGTVADEQIVPLSSQIVMAESAAAAAEAAYSVALQQRAGPGTDSVADIGNSPVLNGLRESRAEILRNISTVNARYGEKHPESVRAHEQLAVVDQQIRAEEQRVLSSLRSEAEAARLGVNSLRAKMAALEVPRRAAASAAVVAEGLESEASAKRVVYDRMSQMSLTSSQAARNPIVQAEVVDRAIIPSEPVSPNRPLFLTFVLLASLVAGTGSVTVRELLTSGLRTAEDLHVKLGLPMLGAVPKLPASKLTREMLLKPSASLFSESFRIAKAALLRGGTTSVPKVLAFPSALPGEGKTTTALAFAGVLVAGGCKTLLLECDVRRAALRPMLGIDSEGPGLVEVLGREADLDEAIMSSGVEDLDLLLVREPHFSAADLFGGGNMEALLDQLKQRYDVIVLDLPPLLGLADGRSLAVLADTNVLVVQWEQTPTKAVESAVSSLRADGANMEGAIYTMVDISAEVVSGLYYLDKYSNYYKSTDG